MLEVAVVVNLATRDQSGSLITGVIYFQVGQHVFSEKEWNNNIALILSWWLDNIATAKREFPFMEGPFSFKESKSGVELIVSGKVQASYPIVWRELHKSILGAAEQVIQYVEGCSHQDLNKLMDKYFLIRD